MPVDALGVRHPHVLEAALGRPFLFASILDFDEKTPLPHLENASGAPLRLARGALPANRLNCLPMTFGRPFRYFSATITIDLDQRSDLPGVDRRDASYEASFLPN